MQATFRQQIEFLAVSHGPGLRLEAILLRRATMIITTTTNRTPAMMRMVVGSIEALSLRIYAAQLHKWPLPQITELSPAFEANKRHKNTLKTSKQQEENQMMDDNCEQHQLCS